MRDPRHDILFQPLAIGPKIARNRFWQVPHCNGMGHRDVRALAAMRGVKAEGGWAVVCTEEVEVHPSSEVSPAIEGRMWSDADIPAHEHVVAAIHAHGALAGIELVYNTPRSNLVSRLPAMGVSAGPVTSDALEPVQARAMDRDDIRAVRRWHRAAALRARKAGYDLIYVYAGHGLALAQQFLSRAFNARGDEYGGSLENRVRFLRELLEDTRDAVGDACAVPLRMAVEESHVAGGLSRAEVEDIVGMLAGLPDAFDFCMGSWAADSKTSRFGEEGFQDSFVRGLKKLTSKPVVGVGRYTSPDAMAAQLRSGALDFVGAARPSIADPFLPSKIEAGAYDDIRECIGCNICVSGDMQNVPLRCTQNPTMGEEWRRSWHPERIAAAQTRERVLVVGAGPAGLEAARALGKRGYDVALAEATGALGGRVVNESALPGLSAWRRTVEYRIGQIAKMPNVEVFKGGAMVADDVFAFAPDRVAVATGATYRRDGAGRRHREGVPIDPGGRVLTPDDIFKGANIEGPVLVYDDDHYVLGGAIAEKLARAGHAVTLATPAPLASYWTQLTLEQSAIEARLVASDVRILTRASAVRFAPGLARMRDDVTGAEFETPAQSVVVVASRTANDELARELFQRRAEWADCNLKTVATIGDAHAPGMIVHAVHSGHAFAQSLGLSVPDADAPPFARDAWRP